MLLFLFSFVCSLMWLKFADSVNFFSKCTSFFVSLFTNRYHFVYHSSIFLCVTKTKYHLCEWCEQTTEEKVKKKNTQWQRKCERANDSNSPTANVLLLLLLIHSLTRCCVWIFRQFGFSLMLLLIVVHGRSSRLLSDLVFGVLFLLCSIRRRWSSTSNADRWNFLLFIWSTCYLYAYAHSCVLLLSAGGVLKALVDNHSITMFLYIIGHSKTTFNKKSFRSFRFSLCSFYIGRTRDESETVVNCTWWWWWRRQYQNSENECNFIFVFRQFRFSSQRSTSSFIAS